MSLAIVVAMAQDRAIGGENQLLWHLPADLKRFKSLTSGHSIIMGRKTYESLPNGALPNRRNIVISKQLQSRENIELVHSLEEALALTEEEDRVYIIGGGQLYESTLPKVSDIHLTIVKAHFPQADTYFPELDWQQWEILHSEEVDKDERNPYQSTYYHLRRIE